MMLEKLLTEIDVREWNTFAVIIAKDGKIIDSHYRRDKNALLPQYSVTKAFMSCAAGILWDSKRLLLDQYIGYYLPQIQSSNNERLKRVKVKHLLMNAMGNSRGYLFEADRHSYIFDDYLELIISMPLKYMAGQKFVYSNSNFYLLSRIIESITGQKADDFVKDNIFLPLEITEYKAVRCPTDHFLGGSGLFLKTSDMVKLGILFGNYGIYRDQRILSKDYIIEAFSPQIRLNSKERYGYAFMMKDSRNVFVPGNYNQILFIDKADNVVVAVNSDVRPSDTGTLMKVIRRCLSVPLS